MKLYWFRVSQLPGVLSDEVLVISAADEKRAWELLDHLLCESDRRALLHEPSREDVRKSTELEMVFSGTDAEGCVASITLGQFSNVVLNQEPHPI